MFQMPCKRTVPDIPHQIVTRHDDIGVLRRGRRILPRNPARVRKYDNAAEKSGERFVHIILYLPFQLETCRPRLRERVSLPDMAAFGIEIPDAVAQSVALARLDFKDKNAAARDHHHEIRFVLDQFIRPAREFETVTHNPVVRQQVAQENIKFFLRLPPAVQFRIAGLAERRRLVDVPAELRDHACHKGKTP